MPLTGATSKIEDALLAHLAELTLTPARRVAWPDTKFDPLGGEVYLTPSVLWNDSERGEIGPGAARRHVGILQVATYGPLAGDTVPQKEVVDAVIEHFDRENFTRNSVTVRIGSFTGGRGVPSRSSSMTDDGWRLIAVSIPFWCDVFPA
jgi:hypothetical protein